MQNAQTVALQLEKVRDKLPLLYERDDILLTMIQQRGDVERVSSRNMRLPLQIRPGGKAGLANLDGGDLGRGSGTTYDVAQVTPVFFRHAVEISKLVEYASNSPEKAIENAAKREVKNNMQQFRSFLDKVMQTNGNGVLGTIASISGSTFTMAKPPGSVLVYYNQSQRRRGRDDQRHGSRSLRRNNHGRQHSDRYLSQRSHRSRWALGRAAGFALRNSLPPDQRHHRYVVEP
jgi:hypothetical protein